MKLTHPIGHSLLFGKAGPGPTGNGSGSPYLRFAQVSDLHFTLNRRIGGREVLTPLIVERLIEHLNSLDLDFILFTGDLIHLPHYIADDLPSLVQRLSALQAPWHAVVGNHDIAGRYAADGRAFWLRTLQGRVGASDHTWYTLQPKPDVHFLVLDTTDHEGGPYTWTRGYVGSGQLEWLHSELARRREGLVILVMHHPIERPLPFEILSMIPNHRRRLLAVLQQSPQVQMVLSGHFHVSRIQVLGTARQIACPGLIEYPHAFRVFNLWCTAPGEFWCDLEWHRVAGIHPADTAYPGLLGGLVRPLVVAGRRGARQTRFRVQVPGTGA